MRHKPTRTSNRATAPEAALDANQIVAWNFRAARELRGWTQEECAVHLAAHLGHQLPKASISAIERSVESDRRREFDAAELVAFARTFDLPVVWFLLPPPELAGHRLADGERATAELVALVLGRDRHADAVRQRLAALAAHDGDSAEQAAAELADFPDDLTWTHYQRLRQDALLALVDKEAPGIEQLLGDLRRVLEKFDQFSLTAFMANHPRHVYRDISHSLLGEEIFTRVINDADRDDPGRYDQLMQLLLHGGPALENAVDLDDRELRDRLTAVYDRIEQRLRAPKRRRRG